MRYDVLVPFAFFAFALCSCQSQKPPATFQSESHGHSHERDKMMLADVGKTPHHAALTAHLSSKDGNELDIFFESSDEEHKPVPLPLTKLTATAKTADGKEHTLEFEPAPKEERKDDPDGKCSHFVAKAGWMKPTDTLSVTLTMEINGKPEPVTWNDFNPQKYAHHID
jgi:hypothetical protein